MKLRAVGFLAVTVIVFAGSVRSEPVVTRYTEGLVHGFLVLRDTDDKILASGELSQRPAGIALRASWYSTSGMVLSMKKPPFFEDKRGNWFGDRDFHR
jgi:hypothetical protein